MNNPIVINERIHEIVSGWDPGVKHMPGMKSLKFASEIRDTWILVEAVGKRGGKILVETWPTGYAAMASLGWQTMPMHWASAETAPMAICQAVLKACDDQ